MKMMWIRELKKPVAVVEREIRTNPNPNPEPTIMEKN